MTKFILTSLPMYVCGLWTILMTCILCVEKKSKSRLLLWLFMITSTTLYAGHFVYLNRIYDEMPIFDSLYSFANLAVYPLFYLYILAMTSPKKNLLKKWWVLLPAILTGLSVSIIYFLMSREETRQFVEITSYNEHFLNGSGLCYAVGCVRMIAKFIFAIEVVAVLIAGSKAIKIYNRNIENFYADTEGKDLNVFKWFMYLFTTCSVVSVVFVIFGRSNFEHSTYVIPSLIFSSLLFGLGFVGLRQSFTLEKLGEDIIDNDNDDVAQEQEEQDSQHEVSLVERIEELMAEQRLYLKHNLKISDISTILNTNRKYVSSALNEDMQVSFSDYTNGKRIEYAVRLMHDYPQMTIADVADRSGFSSDKSFYRNFKNITGKSPKQMLYSQTEEDKGIEDTDRGDCGEDE